MGFKGYICTETTTKKKRTREGTCATQNQEDNDTSGIEGVMILQTRENVKNEKGRPGKSRATGESEGWRRINRVKVRNGRMKAKNKINDNVKKKKRKKRKKRRLAASRLFLVKYFLQQSKDFWYIQLNIFQIQ